MIIARYLTRQIVTVTAAITFVLLIVVVLGRMLKYLAQASQGELDSSVLVLIMSYRLPEFIQLTIPLALMLGILLAYGRLYAESEMTVLIACGLSKSRLLAITSISSGFFAFLIAVLALKVTPWGLENTDTILEAQKELTEFEVMVPGLFQTLSRGARTTYTESVEGDELQNVFMHETALDRITVANTAIATEDEEAVRYILMSDGSITEGLTSGNDYTITDYEEFGVRLPAREVNLDITIEEKAMNTMTLLASDNPAHIAELQWRLSLILLIPILTILVIPLSKVSPRQGRFAKIVPAILLYIIYFGLLLSSRDLVEKGDVPPIIGMWWVHLIFLFIALALFMDKMPGFLRRN